MRKNTLKKPLILLLVLFLTACLNKRQNNDVSNETPPETTPSVVDVTPMLPDAVWQLIEVAEEQKSQAAFDQAIMTLERALRITPHSPLVQQHLAELHLAEGGYEQALQWSKKVMEHGPQLGDLCQRARRTQALAAEMLGLIVVQAEALEAIENCIQKARPRY